MKLIHLDQYDPRRCGAYEDILCGECAHNRGAAGCANAEVVIDAMRSDGNDMGIPVFDFAPDPERRAYQCPGMYPGEDYLKATAQAVVEGAAMRREDQARLAQMGRRVA